MSFANRIGIRKLRSITWYVRELASKRDFLVGTLGFAGPAQLDGLDGNEPGHESLAFEAGACRIVCASPTRDGSAAARFLRRHPEGIGRIVFEVETLDETREHLAGRDATIVTDDASCARPWFEIATPIDDLYFRFVERDESSGTTETSEVRSTPGPSHFDHVTINMGTILPMSLWLRHALDFETYWKTEFHTSDNGPSCAQDSRTGSGLKSSVLWHPASGIKIALNEPRRPNFHSSQIELFRQDYRGSGIQHIALHVNDLPSFVATLRRRGVQFAPIPSPYYDDLEARLDRIGVGPIAEPIGVLRDLGILVDGSGPARYLLQIFVEDDAGFLGVSDKSPFFLELIERKGCEAFGAGNFRALFDSIAAAQAAREVPS